MKLKKWFTLLNYSKHFIKLEQSFFLNCPFPLGHARKKANAQK